MFYVKANLSPDVTIITEVHDDNIYTRCKDCGEEMEVDLDELIHDDQIDLKESSCHCPGWFIKHVI
jgi:hypothetical protein